MPISTFFSKLILLQIYHKFTKTMIHRFLILLCVGYLVSTEKRQQSAPLLLFTTSSDDRGSFIAQDINKSCCLPWSVQKPPSSKRFNIWTDWSIYPIFILEVEGKNIAYNDRLIIPNFITFSENTLMCDKINLGMAGDTALCIQFLF